MTSPTKIARSSLGGKALAAKILWDELAPGIDPLGPDNIMVFLTGPLAGTNAPCSARFNLSDEERADRRHRQLQ